MWSASINRKANLPWTEVKIKNLCPIAHKFMFSISKQNVNMIKTVVFIIVFALSRMGTSALAMLLLFDPLT